MSFSCLKYKENKENIDLRVSKINNGKIIIKVEY